jgi:hypothetical protein
LPHSVLLGWDPEDRAKLIAHLLEQAGRCQLCGTSAWEWEQDPYAYAPGQDTCKGCYVKEAAAEDAPNTPGSRVVLIPRANARDPLPVDGVRDGLGV